MPIQVSKQMVGVFCCRGVPVPFSNVVAQKSFINVALGFFVNFDEVLCEVVFEIRV